MALNLDELNLWSGTVPPFGKLMRKEFLLDENVTFLNHCAKGAVPRIVHLQQIRLAGLLERNPEYFLKVRREEEWLRNSQLIAQFVGAQVQNITFVENTTRGMCNIIKSFPFAEGEAILYNTFTHQAVKNQIEHLLHMNKGLRLETLELQLDLPASSADIIDTYKYTLKRKHNIKLAVIDYVCGSPATLFPVAKLIKLCHKYDVNVLIDGAHAPGLIEIDLEKLKADFFVGNLHKWLFCPRGCAIQYVAPKHHHYIKPCVTSFNWKSPYPLPFQDQGTRNDAPYLCVESALQFYSWIGGYEEIYNYNNSLINEATQLLTSSWCTCKAAYSDEEEVPFIRNICLPQLPAYSKDKEGCRRLRYDLYYRFRIWVGVFHLNNENWIRISSQIYCCLEDYIKLKDAILELAQEQPDDVIQVESKRQFEHAIFSGT